MVLPPGISFLARSTPTWIHWWSPVASANLSIIAWVTVSHSDGPSSLPTCWSKSWGFSTLSMASLPRGMICGRHYRAVPGTHPMSYDAPFAGLKVVDLSQGIAGPYSAMLLAQYDADVIKVEPPEGDWARALGKR